MTPPPPTSPSPQSGSAVPDELLLQRAFDVDAHSFFDDPDLVQRSNLIRHLVQSTRLAILVTGSAEVGKTTCLDHLEHTADERWVLCRIAGNTTQHADRVLARLARCCDLPPDCGRLALRQLLGEHAAMLVQNSKLPVIALDDAHGVDAEALAELVALSSSETGWRLLLFAEPGHQDRMAQAGLNSAARVHELDWPPLSEVQTGAYVQYRLERAGWNGELPLNVEQVRKLHRDSGGLPGVINRLAAGLLAAGPAKAAGTKPARPAEARAKPLPLRKLVRGAAVVLLVAGVAVILSQQDRINALFEPEDAPTAESANVPGTATAEAPVAADRAPEAAAPDAQQPAEAESAPSLPTAPDNTQAFDDAVAALTPAPWLDEAPPTSEAPAVRATPESASAPGIAPHAEEVPPGAPNPESAPRTDAAAAPAVRPPDTDTAADSAATVSDQSATVRDDRQSAPQESIAIAPDTSPPEESAAQTSAPDRPEPEPGPATPTPQETTPKTAEPLPTAQTAAPAASEAGTPRVEASSGKGWLLARPQDHYTLQLLGSRDIKTVTEAVQRYDLTADTAWYKVQYQGADWFVLVHGDFPNRAAASRALAGLPAGLRRAGPWPRPFAAIQEEVRSGRK